MTIPAAQTLIGGIAILKDAIIADYRDWTTRSNFRNVDDSVDEFIRDIKIVEGKKYTKIMQANGVWGFVVAVDNDKKFSKGTILKAAGYKAPARNASRGNVLDGGYTIRWTGPLYLK